MTDRAEKSSKTPQEKKLFNYGCFLLARRRYSISEFRRKLEKKFPELPEEITKIIDQFQERKYLDDTQYTSLFIREQLHRKPQGLRLIKQKLRQKGINEATLSSVFQDELTDEPQLIQQALEKKRKTMRVSSPLQAKQKLFRFLISRGFDYENIMKALSGTNNFTDS